MKLGLTPKLHEACSKDAGRYALQSIMCERDGDVMRLVATNRLILAVVEREAHADDVSGLIPAEAWKAACKAKPARKYDADFHAIVANDAVRVSNGGTVTEFPRPEPGEFPNWHKVLPKKGQGTVRVALNPRLLLALAEALGLPSKAESVVLEIQPDVKDGNGGLCAPIRVETAGGYGAIMPITIDR